MELKIDSVWQLLLVTFGGNAALLTALAWLIKSLLTHRLTKDSKVFESELKAKADVSIEQLKSSLHLAAVEHQVRFSNLHQRRAEVIAELYKRLVEAFWAAQNFVSVFEWAGEPSKPEKYVAAMEKLRQFFIFFDTQRIYLPDDICKLLDSFIADVRSPVIGFGVYVAIERPTEKTMQEKMNSWMKAYETLEKDIPLARRALEAEFRRILSGAEI